MTDTKKPAENTKRTSAEDKWTATNEEARAIMDTEVAAREKKTERLRSARLAREALKKKEAKAAPKKTKRAASESKTK